MSQAAQEVLFFEDVQIRQSWRTPGRKITEEDISRFADLTGDNDPLHTDPQYAAETPYRKPIAHGLLGLSYLAGLSSECPKMRNIAFVSVDRWQFRAPVFIGDIVCVETTITDMQRKGRRAGEITWHRKLINQDGRVVQEGQLVTLVACRTLVRKSADGMILKMEQPHGISKPKSRKSTSTSETTSEA